MMEVAKKVDEELSLLNAPGEIESGKLPYHPLFAVQRLGHTIT